MASDWRHIPKQSRVLVLGGRLAVRAAEIPGALELKQRFYCTSGK